MGEWTLNVGNIAVQFKTSKYGTLGYKFNSSKQGKVEYEFYAPLYSSKKIDVYNPDHPQETFIDVRYTNDKSDKKYRVNEITKKYFEISQPTVFISMDQMSQMFPQTKEATVVSKQPLTKLNITNVNASEGYYLLPVREYSNITKYKKLIEWLGGDFIITSPVRLTMRSGTTHNYAIYVDKKQSALVAMEVLVKAGKQPEPEI
jgi:hypothetical protein